MSFGEKIRARRKELNLTQAELAKRVGYSDKSTIAKIESGDRNAHQSTILKLAKALGVTPAYLMETEDEYYFNAETAEIAQEIHDSQELKVLFDITRDADPEDLKALYQMALALKRKSNE